MSRHFHDFFVTVGERQRVAVRDFAANGPPMVLLHGEGSNLALWEKVAGLISPNFHVVALDLPGYGASSAPQKHSPETDLLALRAVVMNLGLVRPVVVGHLYGGTVAGAFRSAYQNCALALALTDSAAELPVGPSASDQGTTQWRDAQIAMQNAIMNAVGISPGVFHVVAERMYQPLTGGGWERKPRASVEAQKHAHAQRMFARFEETDISNSGDQSTRVAESDLLVRVLEGIWAPLTAPRRVAELIVRTVTGL